MSPLMEQTKFILLESYLFNEEQYITDWFSISTDLYKFTAVLFSEDSQINFVTKNVPWTFRGEGVLSWMFLLSQINIDF